MCLFCRDSKKAELLQNVEKQAAKGRPGSTRGRRYDSDMERNSVFPDFVWSESDSGYYRGAIPNMPYDAMVEVPAYIGKKGPEVIAQNEIPLFQQGLMMQQLNSEKLLVEGCIEGSYEKVLKAFTLNKTVPSMKVAKEILDDMIEANKGYWPELK